MLVKPTKRKYQRDVLQRLGHKRIKEFHRRSGKGNNGKCIFEKQLQKINISPNLNKSSDKKFFYLRNKLLLDVSLKTSKNQPLQHFSKLTQKYILEKTSKTKGAHVEKQCPEGLSDRILAKTNLQCNHYRTPCLNVNSSSLVETTRGIPSENSSQNSRKTLKRQKIFEVPRRSLRSNSSQIYNENKSSRTKESKALPDESMCLKRGRKSSLQATSLPNITREIFTAKSPCQPIKQCLVRKITSINQIKAEGGTKQFCCHQCGKCFTQNSYFSKHMKFIQKASNIVAMSVEKIFTVPAA